LLMGAMGPGIRGEHRTALEMPSLSGGERVRDVAYGTGDFTTPHKALLASVPHR